MTNDDRDLYIHGQRVVQLRTYQSIAEETGLSRQRVHQIVIAVSQQIRKQQANPEEANERE